MIRTEEGQALWHKIDQLVCGEWNQWWSEESKREWMAAVEAAETGAARAERELMRSMRHDYQTLPHAEFPVKWPGWRAYQEVLPRTCDCQDCRLWRSGS